MVYEMGNTGSSNGRRPGPAPGLSALTPTQVMLIDSVVQEVCAVGFGTVKIVIQDGLPRFVSQTRSQELKPS